ncbi:hypothetical protein GEMRC1_011507 [Eukaryota sp. GEM-RC1]
METKAEQTQRRFCSRAVLNSRSSRIQRNLKTENFEDKVCFRLIPAEFARKLPDSQPSCSELVELDKTILKILETFEIDPAYFLSKLPIPPRPTLVQAFLKNLKKVDCIGELVQESDDVSGLKPKYFLKNYGKFVNSVGISIEMSRFISNCFLLIA